MDTELVIFVVAVLFCIYFIREYRMGVSNYVVAVGNPKIPAAPPYRVPVSSKRLGVTPPNPMPISRNTVIDTIRSSGMTEAPCDLNGGATE